MALFSILNQKPYYQLGPSQAPRMFEISGYYQTPSFAALNAISLDAGDFYVNSHVVSANASDFDYYKMLSENDGSALYGTYTTFKLLGNPSDGIDSFIRTMYIPEEIEMSSPPDEEIYKTTSSNNIFWNADPNNTNGVFIKIMYDGTYSNSLDSTMPLNDIVFTNAVSDNGSYTIASSVLAAMPIGGTVKILIGRGNGIEIDKNNKKIYVTAASITYQRFKLAP